MTTLADLEAAVATLRRANDDASHAVADAFDAFLAGRADSIDDALNLRRCPGQRRRSTIATTDERDDLLREMAAEHFGHLAPTPAAAEVERVVGRYEASAWRREQRFDECPERLAGTPQAFAWRLLKLGIRIPGKRQIRRIIGDKPLKSISNVWP